MRELTSSAVVGVVGAGAMGSGIAQVAASRGHRVVLGDAKPGAATNAGKGMRGVLDALVGRGKITAAERDDTMSRLEFIDRPLGRDLSPYRACDFVIEAVVEDLEVKQALFRDLAAVVAPDAVIATNTSSLSVAAIASSCPHSERVLGVHFFNPPPVMPLVEIIPWLGSEHTVVDRVDALIAGWGKTTVRASDTPGFIVNRVARPFYGESLRLYEEGIADFVTIDWALRELGGFKMDPFELMDLIGNDVNFAVTKTIFEGMFYEPRYRPSLTQKSMVVGGRLGRKSGVGYYDYRTGHARPTPTEDRALGQRIVDRVVAMLINEAAEAVLFRVATAADIDLAMTKGVNYPKGLLAWCDEVGARVIYDRLRLLQEEYGEDRYRPSALLRQLAQSGGRFHA